MEIREEITVARSKLRKLGSQLKKIIFGPDQAAGIDIMVASLLVPTQWTVRNRPVSSIFIVGGPGCGKTTLGEAAAKLINTKFTMIAGLDDMTPSQLTGHIEFVPSPDGSGEEVERYREGYIKSGSGIVLFDEAPRAGRGLMNSFAHVLASGSVVVGGKHIDIAPEGESLTAIMTANPLLSSGTRELGEFFTDRIVATLIFRTAWENDAYLRTLLSPREHMEKLEREGVFEPVLKPRDIIETQNIFNTHMRTPEAAKEYCMKLIRTIVSLSHPGWSDKLPRGLFPSRWQKLRTIPTDPLMYEIAGRFPQHLETLSGADSFVNHGSLETLIPSIQQIAKSVLVPRLMYRLREGGEEILDEAYDNEVIPFVIDTLDWIVSLVPAILAPPSVFRRMLSWKAKKR